MNILSLCVAFSEWYDISLWIVFSEQIIAHFFADLHKVFGFSLNIMLSTCPIIGKPIGALLIGYYSDRVSRIYAAYFSFIFITICNVLLIITPTYQMSHHINALCFIFIKCLQGIATAGHYTTNIYSIEQSKNKYFVSSLTSVAIFLGFFTAHGFYVICNLYLPLTSVYTWKLGLLLHILLAIPIMLMFQQEINQQNITPAPQNIRESSEEKFTQTQLLKGFLKTSVLCLLDILPFQYLHVFLPQYKTMILKIDEHIVKEGVFITLIIILLLAPFSGYKADQTHSAKKFIYTSAVMMVLAWFIEIFIGIHHFTQYHLTDIYFGVMMGLCYGTLYTYIPLQLSTRYRASITGLALHCTTTFTIIAFTSQYKFFANNIFHLLGGIGCVALYIL